MRETFASDLEPVLLDWRLLLLCGQGFTDLSAKDGVVVAQVLSVRG